ncbi:hypothetical protein L596_004854 [Steinernema carpocapsae]|uniref:Dolichyl-diphosphooligosaccharide--protein glycosyltransferase subunit 1 n=1 Tax=Steinernema carpocapsae TaxID=34508 RepID=A0A4U8UX76_STECR|nr:hypothetical protein L596_004854 [Steinernema carpocapsae]
MHISWVVPSLICIALCNAAFAPGVTIQSATRKVDLASQIVKTSVDYMIQNNGDAELTSFIHVISKKEAGHVAYVSGTQGKGSGRLKVNLVTPEGASSDFTYYKIDLSKPVPARGTGDLTVTHLSTGMLTPHPAEITQAENQFVLYNGDAHVSSIYGITKESSVFTVGSGKTLSFTESGPTKQTGDRVTYGPYANQKPFTTAPITIHYENNAPFVVAASLVRTIEISHWGNIAVEDNIELVHKGAVLAGPFSRLDYQLDRRGTKQPVVRGYKTLLPTNARDIYYRDLIGNISTSNVRQLTNSVEVELRPRFPLFGGWKTNYVLGYNVPTSDFLASSGEHFQLRMRAIDEIFENAVIEHVTVRVILPEGSTDIKLVTPYSVKRAPDALHFTYLDISGRPVITFEKDNVVEKHAQKFTLKYSFSRLYILREPCIAMAAFFVLFFTVIVYTRLDFSLSSERRQE